jgi:hypothetical protein
MRHYLKRGKIMERGHRCICVGLWGRLSILYSVALFSLLMIGCDKKPTAQTNGEGSGKGPQPANAEAQLALPEFYGTYAVDSGKTFDIGSSKVEQDLTPNAQFIVFDKSVSSGTGNITFVELFDNVRLPQNVEIRTKPIANHSDMIMLVPIDPLEPGHYQLGKTPAFWVQKQKFVDNKIAEMKGLLASGDDNSALADAGAVLLFAHLNADAESTVAAVNFRRAKAAKKESNWQAAVICAQAALNADPRNQEIAAFSKDVAQTLKAATTPTFTFVEQDLGYAKITVSDVDVLYHIQNGIEVRLGYGDMGATQNVDAWNRNLDLVPLNGKPPVQVIYYGQGNDHGAKMLPTTLQLIQDVQQAWRRKYKPVLATIPRTRTLPEYMREGNVISYVFELEPSNLSHTVQIPVQCTDINCSYEGNTDAITIVRLDQADEEKTFATSDKAWITGSPGCYVTLRNDGAQSVTVRLSLTVK